MKVDEKRFNLAITFQTVTPESAEIGDFEDQGFEVEEESASLMDIADYVGTYGEFPHTSCYPPSPGCWWSTEGEADIQTGEEKTYSIFVENTDGSVLSQSDFDLVSKILSCCLSYRELESVMDGEITFEELFSEISSD